MAKCISLFHFMNGGREGFNDPVMPCLFIGGGADQMVLMVPNDATVFGYKGQLYQIRLLGLFTSGDLGLQIRHSCPVVFVWEGISDDEAMRRIFAPHALLGEPNHG